MATGNKSIAIQSAAVLLVAITGWAALALRLQQELGRKTVDLKDREAVAKLQTSVKQVQRKYDREVLWDEVRRDEVLYNHDSVRTAAGSEAKIKFEDGTVLELSENSLVVLDRSDDKLNIEFLKGSVFARGGGGQGGKGLQIQTASGKVSMGAGGKGALSLSQDGAGLEVTVAEGSAQLLGAGGAQSIGANERAAVGAAGMTKQKLAVWTISPAPNAKVIVEAGAKAPVAFKWGGEKAARVQIAADPGFGKLVTEQSGEAVALSKLAEGSYYWRVVLLEGNRIKDASDTRVLRVLKHPPVKLESPAVNAAIEVFRAHTGVKVSWRVLGSSAGGRERVEVARDEKFKELLQAAAMTSRDDRGEALFEKLEPGEYFWRVVTRYEDSGSEGKGGTEVPTEVRRFRYAKLDRLPAPEPLEPALGQTVGIGPRSPKARFQWKPVLEAAAYRIRVGTDPEFSAPLVNEWVATPAWEGELSVSGSLYWSVQAVSGKEPSSEDSKPAKPVAFQLARSGGFRLLSPKPGEAITYLGEVPEVSFAWEKIGGAERYEVQVSPTERFESVQFTQAVRGDPEMAPVLKTRAAPVGSRYWRVRAMNGSKVVALSEVATYHLKEAALLAAPEKVAPVNQAKINSEQALRVRFEWKPIAQAKGYAVTAWKANAEGKLEPVWTGEASGEKENFLEQDLGSGSYLWDVRAVDAAGRKGIAGAQRAFELKRPEWLVAPELRAPAKNERIEGGAPHAIPLRWEKVEGAEAYQVTVSRVDRPGVAEKVREERVTGRELVLPESIPSGTYEWKVSAIGVASGARDRTPRPGDAGVSQFAVKWIGVLQAPARVRVKVEADREPAAAATPPARGRPTSAVGKVGRR